MKGFAWLVLTLVFLDELAAMAAYAVWGARVPTPGVVWAVVLPVVAMTAWWLFASPKARFGSGGRREVVKVVVVGLACLALWNAGLSGWAFALLVFSVTVNAAALHPQVRAVAAAT